LNLAQKEVSWLEGKVTNFYQLSVQVLHSKVNVELTFLADISVQPVKEL